MRANNLRFDSNRQVVADVLNAYSQEAKQASQGRSFIEDNSDDRWTNPQRAYLIESLLLRFPVDFIYEAWILYTPINSAFIIKGWQRLRALYLFTRDEFPLSGLKYFSELNGLTYTQLSRPLQRRILETELTFIRVSCRTPEQLQDIIHRIQ